MKGIELATVVGFAVWLGISANQPSFGLGDATDRAGLLSAAPLAIAQSSSNFNGTPRYTDAGANATSAAGDIGGPAVAAGAGDVYSVPGTYAPPGTASQASPLPSPYAMPAPSPYAASEPSSYTAPGSSYVAPGLSPPPGSITPFSSSNPSYSSNGSFGSNGSYGSNGSAGSTYAANPSYGSSGYAAPGQSVEVPGGLRGPAAVSYPAGYSARYPDATSQATNPPIQDTTGLPPHSTKSGGGGGGAVGATVGLTDRAAKSSVGLADRAAKTSIGAPVKVLKSLF